MTSVTLIRCDSVEQVIEDGDPCAMLCAKLVLPVNSANSDSGVSEYQAVEPFLDFGPLAVVVLTPSADPDVCRYGHVRVLAGA